MDTFSTASSIECGKNKNRNRLRWKKARKIHRERVACEIQRVWRGSSYRLKVQNMSKIPSPPPPEHIWEALLRKDVQTRCNLGINLGEDDISAMLGRICFSNPTKQRNHVIHLVAVDISNTLIGRGKINPKNLLDMVRDGRDVVDALAIGSYSRSTTYEKALQKFSHWSSHLWRLKLMERTRDNKEKGVDEGLVAELSMTLLRDQETFGRTIVIVTGDGNENDGNPSFIEVAKLALDSGWFVELWSWSNKLSSNYKTSFFKQYLDQGKFKVLELDKHKKNLFSSKNSTDSLSNLRSLSSPTSFSSRSSSIESTESLTAETIAAETIAAETIAAETIAAYENVSQEAPFSQETPENFSGWGGKGNFKPRSNKQVIGKYYGLYVKRAFHNVTSQQTIEAVERKFGKDIQAKVFMKRKYDSNTHEPFWIITILTKKPVILDDSEIKLDLKNGYYLKCIRYQPKDDGIVDLLKEFLREKKEKRCPVTSMQQFWSNHPFEKKKMKSQFKNLTGFVNANSTHFVLEKIASTTFIKCVN